MKYYELIASFNDYDKEKSGLYFLATEILEISKSELYTNISEEIDEGKLTLLNEAINKYVKYNIPVQYIVGYTYFYGLKIKVNNSVLIPRFETEELVDIAIKIARKNQYQRIIDIGTGSGCIAIALKKHLPTATIDALDISIDAINVAKDNAYSNNVDINIFQNDLLKGVESKYDLIVSNPPYIDANEEVMGLVYDNEPHLALFSPNNGLYHYSEILEQSRKVLSSNGKIIFEIAYNKKQEMVELARKYYQKIEVIKDIHNNDRIMIIG